MTVIKKATVKSYDAAEHKATVQIAGSLPVWLDGVRVATDIPAADVQAGRQCTVLFVDPSNPDDAVVITIQGALPSGGGGGSTTFLGLTDTPAGYAGAALQTLRVNAAADAVEFHDPYAAAHTWAALQTFSAGIKLAAAQQIQDSSATGRILLATASPHITLTGSTLINSNVGIDSAPSTSPDIKLVIHPSTTGVTDWRGIQVNPSLTLTGSGRFAYGIFGSATINIPAATSGHSAYGLDFVAVAIPGGLGCAVTNLCGCKARPGLAAFGATKALTVTNWHGFETGLFDTVTVIMGGAVTLTTAKGLYVKGATKNVATLSIPTTYGVHIEDFQGSSFGTVRLLEVGPSTPYLRVVGKSDPNANQSNLYLKLGSSLKHVTEGAADSGGSGYRVLRVPN